MYFCSNTSLCMSTCPLRQSPLSNNSSKVSVLGHNTKRSHGLFLNQSTIPKEKKRKHVSLCFAMTETKKEKTKRYANKKKLQPLANNQPSL